MPPSLDPFLLYLKMHNESYDHVYIHFDVILLFDMQFQ